MLNIILLLLVGSGLTYISQYNLALVSVDMGFYQISDIPLFYVIVGSVIIGLVLSYLLQLVRDVSTYLEIRRKSKQIKSSQAEILDLTKTVHKLELQNEKLKHTGPETSDSKAL